MCLKGFSLDEKVDRLKKAETLIYVIKMYGVVGSTFKEKSLKRIGSNPISMEITFFDINVFN